MKFINFSKLSPKNKLIIKKKIYNLIIEKMKLSVFTFLNFKEFEKIYFNVNKEFIYIDIVNKKINCLLTYLPEKNEKILRDNLLSTLFKNPIQLLNFFFNLSNLFKNIKPPIEYLQLFHIINVNLKKIKKKKKYSLINNLHRKVIKGKYKGIYVIYRNTNFIAKKYYYNNNFKIYKKNLFYSLAVKKF